MISRSIRGRVAAATCLLTTLGLLPATAGPAAAIPTAPTVGQAVTDALVAASGSAAIADDSTDCISDDPQPVAYRTDRVVLRTSMSEPAVANTVNAALAGISVPSHVTKVDIISMTGIPGAGGVVPVASVSLAPIAGTLPIKKLARRLRLKEGVPASPDYLLSPSSGPTEFWPNGGPRPAEALAPQRDPWIGAHKTIFVYDTGLPLDGEGLRPPNVTNLSSDDLETPDSVAPAGVVDLGSAGHTIAIAGVINTIAPGAAVTAVRITEPNGVATDVSAASSMAATLQNAYETGTWPDLIVNAFGSPACDGGPGLPGEDLAPLGEQMVAEAVNDNGYALILASAGNRSSGRPFYPAAFSTVIGVGGLDTTGADGDAWTSRSRSGPRADFSNWGRWVDAWMPAVDLATNHVKGYKFDPNGPVINGMAFVDGTSFAAPMAAALVAEEMAASGSNAKTAWLSVLQSGVTCSSAIGSGVALALTSLDSKATTPALPKVPVEC